MPSLVGAHTYHQALAYICANTGGMGGVAHKPSFSQHPVRPGQPDCSFYVKTGSCKFGEACKFNHPLELGSGGSKVLGGTGSFNRMDTSVRNLGGAAMTTADGYPVRPGAPDCSFYMKTGQCKYMQTCKFNHPRKGPTGLPSHA